MSKTTMVVAMTFAGLVSAGASLAQAATTTTASASFNVDMTSNCASGGTRAVKGTYDATSGALDTTTTLTACIVRNGDKFDGTTTTKGTLLSTSTGFTIDITSTVSTTIVRSDLSTVKRTCTSTKKGTFTNANQTFDGTTSQTNCSVVGKVLEHEGLVEHLLRAAHGQEDGGGLDSGSRMIPPQRGEDSIRFQTDMPAMGGIGGMGDMGGRR